MSRIRQFILENVLPKAFQNIDVQYPMPTDSDSTYEKDIWVEESITTNWVDADGTGDDPAVIPFNNLHSAIRNTTSDNPKTIRIHFNRTIQASQVGLGCADHPGENFSNVFVKLLGSGGTVRDVNDDSANNTKYTSRNYQFEPQLFNALLLEFHTADPICISNITIQKTTQVDAFIKGQKPDGTVENVQTTQSGNLKISLEELENQISVNANSQLRTTTYHEDGTPGQLITGVDYVAGKSGIDASTETLQTIDYAHHEIHSGSHYFYSDCITLGGAATQDYMLTTPNTATKSHMLFEVTGTSATDVSFFEGGDRVGTTLQATYNNYRDSLNSAGTTLHKGISGGTTDGTDIHPDCFGSGTAGGRGGVSTRENEIVLAANTKYILRITSGGAGNRIAVHFDWYEHTDKN